MSYSTKIEYNTIVKYKQGEVISFPDFTLQYIGTRVTPVLNTQLGITWYDFKIKDASHNEVISWSSGLGCIAPLKFEFNNKAFMLEQVFSIHGKLNPNELVITEKTVYNEIMKRIIQ